MIEDEPSITDLDEDQIRWGRQAPAAERLIAGAQLFDYACSITMAGIRRQHPSATEEEALQMLRDRLTWAEQWD